MTAHGMKCILFWFNLCFSGACIHQNQVEVIKSHSNKPWSHDNKFLVRYNNTNMHMKIGENSIVYEYAYYTIAKQMGTTDIVMHTELVSRGNSKIAILSPWVPNIINNWKISEQCLDICSPRAFQILVIDYLIGYIDRPANCHIVNNKIFAIDNDSGSETIRITENSVAYQYNVIDVALKTKNSNLCACADLNVLMKSVYIPLPPMCFSVHQAALWTKIFRAAKVRLLKLRSKICKSNGSSYTQPDIKSDF